MTKPRFKVGVATSLSQVFLSHRVFRLADTMPQFEGAVDGVGCSKGNLIMSIRRAGGRAMHAWVE